MILDEAIARYKNNAEYERTHGNLQGCLEFRQLAEWLKELRVFKSRKGHGRLIDADVLWDLYHSNDYDFYEALDRAPTIIEADRSEEE